MSAAVPREDAASLIRYVNSNLIVRQLQAVLKYVGQPTSGLKAPLQRRLINHIESMVKNNDLIAFQRLKNFIYHPEVQSPAGAFAQHPAGHSTSSTGRSNPPSYPPTFSMNINLPRILFKESPFYTILSALSEHSRCPVMTTNRNTVTTVVTLSQQQIQQLNNDNSYRCMVYCAALEPLAGFTRDTDITFPHQVELRVNDTVVTGLNLRGLKNKPGSTRPADITDKLNKRANYRNEIGLTYAITQKEFVFIVNLVKIETVDNLVKVLRSGSFITKEQVIAEMVKKNEDADLVATSTIMSLKCPLSTLRIGLPVRSQYCTHAQCFDAASFLQLQLQAPTWTCPTCNRSIAFKHLVIDRYFDDILNTTPKTVESVTIDADGKWWVAVEVSNSPVPDSSDDEGNFEFKVVDLENGRPERSVPSAAVTPATSNARDESLPAGRNSSKRPVSQIIDLTLSDDDEPSRPAKRNTAFPTPSSVGSATGFVDPAANGYSPVGTPQTYDYPPAFQIRRY